MRLINKLIILISTIIFTGCVSSGESHSFYDSSGLKQVYEVIYSKNIDGRFTIEQFSSTLDSTLDPTVMRTYSSTLLSAAIITAKEKGYHCFQIIDKYPEHNHSQYYSYTIYRMEIQSYRNACTSSQKGENYVPLFY